MDGYELARRLRGLPGEQRPRHLLAVTGHGGEPDRRRAREAGFDEHVVKPVSAAMLLRTLNTLFKPA